LRGHIKAPKILRFSPDSKTLVTISADGTARVWNTEDGAALYRKSVLVDEFAGVAVFSKDSGRLLLAAGDEHMIHPVVDARTGDLLTTLRGHLYPVLDAAFSHDGSRIVTGSLDGTARLWDAATGVELVKLGGESELTREPNPFKPKKRSSGGFFSIGDFSILDESVLHVGFNADGSRAFALRRSGELRLFDIPDLATLMAEAKTHLGRPLTPQERETYFLDSE
jgi:WD40 repeat protein